MHDAHACTADGTSTTPLQWGLACIRSRAFQLTPALFASVPFADLANHATKPNARLDPVLDCTDTIQSGSSDNWVVMRALEDISAGDEVTVSYTGVAGATNRRLLVQYGFVLPDNENDRLDFELFDGYIGTTPLRGAPCALPPLPPGPAPRATSQLYRSTIQTTLSHELAYKLMQRGLCAMGGFSAVACLHACGGAYGDGGP